MTSGEDFMRNAKCKSNHRSALSNSASCDENSKGIFPQIHDLCPNLNCKRQKQCTFNPRQFHLEGSGFTNIMRKIFKGIEKILKNFIETGLKIATLLIPAGISAKTKIPQSAQITSKILKSLTGCKILSLRDLHGNGLRLNVM